MPKKLDLLQTAADYVTQGAHHGSPSGIQRTLSQKHSIHIEFDTACRILAQLCAAGIVAPRDRETHAYPVLMTQAEATEALRALRQRDEDWGPFYECPQCSRAAQWTNGRSVKAGDDVDEFWCQTCGSEIPLATCAVIAA